MESRHSRTRAPWALLGRGAALLCFMLPLPLCSVRHQVSALHPLLHGGGGMHGVHAHASQGQRALQDLRHGELPEPLVPCLLCLTFPLWGTLHSRVFVRPSVQWGETHKQCNRLKLADMVAKPHQRLTKYPLLLKSILKKTDEPSARDALNDMVRMENSE